MPTLTPWAIVLLVIAAGLPILLFVLRGQQTDYWRKEASATKAALEGQEQVCDRLRQESARDQMDAETARKEMGRLQEETTCLTTVVNSERESFERLRQVHVDRDEETRKHFEKHSNAIMQQLNQANIELEKEGQKSRVYQERVTTLDHQLGDMYTENENMGATLQQMTRLISQEKALVATFKAWAVATKAELIFVRSHFGQAGQQSVQAWAELDQRLREDCRSLAMADMTVAVQQMNKPFIPPELNGELQEASVTDDRESSASQGAPTIGE